MSVGGWVSTEPPWAPDSERTGSYRTRDDVMVTDAAGNTAIAGADFAIAFVDEIEKPAHHQYEGPQAGLLRSAALAPRARLPVAA